MLNIEDIKLLNKVLNEEEVSDKDYEKISTKLKLVVEQIELGEKANKEMALIQDKIAELEKNKDDKNE